MSEPARRFALAGAVGAGIVLVVFFLFLRTGSPGFFDEEPFGVGAFYDAQARSLFHGRWNAGSGAFFLERVNIDGKFYMYFGPWPALLRMPILLVTSRLDGGLTRLSLLLAAVTLFVAVGRVLWQVRGLCGRAGSPSRRELVGVAGFMVLIGCGSTIVFLSAGAWVYDEAILWGTAWALWSLHFAIAHILAPSRTMLILTAVTTTLAILSRIGSAAIGVGVLGVLFGLQLLGTRRRPPIRRLGMQLATMSGIDAPVVSRRPWPTGVAALTPLVVHAPVNWAKFRMLFNVPFDKQDIVLSRTPSRAQVLAENGNNLVALDQVPTNLVHYLRLDGFSVDRLFPFIDFSNGVTNIGGVARDPEGPTASLTVTTTLLVAFAVIGLAIVFVPRIARRTDLEAVRALRLPAVAAAMAFVPTMIFPAASERYKADLTPLLVLVGGVGLYAVADFVRGMDRRRRVVIGAAAIVLTFNVWTNLALTLNFQRAYQIVRSPADRAAYVLDRVEWTERLGLEPSVDFVQGDRETATERPAGSVGSFLVVDGCTQLLVSNGWQWLELALDDPRATCRALGLPASTPPPTAARGSE